MLEYSSKKMLMMESRYNKVTSFPTFSLRISNFSEQPFCRPHTNNFLWSLDVFLIFYREALLSSPSESASNRNSEEQLIEKFLEKSAKFLSGKDASCMATPCNFTLNKTFSILALSFSLIDVIGFKFCSLT